MLFAGFLAFLASLKFKLSFHATSNVSVTKKSQFGANSWKNLLFKL